MFGSDGPGADPIRAAEQILALKLTDQEKQMILADNAKRVIKI